MMRTLLSLACLLASVSSHAAVVIDGRLFGTGNGFSSQPPGSNTVDFYGITMNSAGQLNIDTRSWERTNFDGAWVDLNGDGKAAFVDTFISVFDGSVSVANLLGEIDDSDLGADGSIYGFDANLTVNLLAGNYWIAVSACCSGADDIVDGTQDTNIGNAMVDGDPTLYPNMPFYGHTHGDYRITLTGDVTVTSRPQYQTNPNNVPEPATFGLLGLGMFGLAATRRRKA